MSLARDALPFPSFLGKQMQLGYVVKDIDAALRFWTGCHARTLLLGHQDSSPVVGRHSSGTPVQDSLGIPGIRHLDDLGTTLLPYAFG